MKCINCGWVIAPEGVYLPEADECPDGAKPHRCDDTACVAGDEETYSVGLLNEDKSFQWGESVYVEASNPEEALDKAQAHPGCQGRHGLLTVADEQDRMVGERRI